MLDDLTELRLPDAVTARLQVDRKPRSAATGKLRDLLRRAAATSAIRAVWVYGSYARGAGTVGDVDLAIAIDDPREASRAAFDGYRAYIRGANPDSDVLKALGASGNSIVEATVSRNHDSTLGEPLPVEDFERLPAAERQRFVPVVPPILQHAGTGELLDVSEMRLLYCRGDSVTKAHERLASIGEDPDAARYPRTTGIPLLDELASRIGGANQALLERCLRAGAIRVATHIADPPPAGELPASIEATLDERFDMRARRHESKGISRRHQMLRAGLAALQTIGVDLSVVLAFGSPADRASVPDDARVLLDSGQSTLQRLGEYLVEDERSKRPCFDRVALLLDPKRKPPWIVLDFTAEDQPALRRIVTGEHARIRAIFQRQRPT